MRMYGVFIVHVNLNRVGLLTHALPMIGKIYPSSSTYLYKSQNTRKSSKHLLYQRKLQSDQILDKQNCGRHFYQEKN